MGRPSAGDELGAIFPGRCPGLAWSAPLALHAGGRGHSVGIPWAFRGHSVGIPWVLRGSCVGLAWVLRGSCVGVPCRRPEGAF